MRQILPCERDDEVDVLAAVAAEDRTADERPWVLLNMVASVDGVCQDTEGRSGGLAGEADKELFHALRAISDVVLAGANTVRAEHYGPPRLPPGAAELRQRRGQAPLPRLAVVSRSLRLDPAAKLFSAAAPDHRPILLTTEGALSYAPELAEQLATVADLRVAGERNVGWKQALRLLYEEMNARIVLVEGGPTVNAQLVAADLVDELCLTVSPMLMGGGGLRMVVDPDEPMVPKQLQLDRAFEADGFLLLRYTRVHH